MLLFAFIFKQKHTYKWLYYYFQTTLIFQERKSTQSLHTKAMNSLTPVSCLQDFPPTGHECQTQLMAAIG